MILIIITSIFSLLSQGHVITVKFDLSQEIQVGSRVFLAGSWNDWAPPSDFELFHDGNGKWSGSKDFEPGTYEFVVTSGNTAGWGDHTFKPEAGSQCDFTPENEWNNYGFAVSGPKTVSFCASFCAATCDDPVDSLCPSTLLTGRADGLIFEDDFSAASVDPCIWKTLNQRWNLNEEQEFYTSRTENVRTANGKLLIEAREEPYAGAEWTSGRLESADYFTTGRIEISARLPKGQGLWPALWLLGKSWPTDGEVDMMENLGHALEKFATTVHWGESASAREFQWTGDLETCDLSEDFHVWSVDRSESEIVFLFDNRAYARYSYADLKTQNPAFEVPFAGPMKVILNTAVGGAYLMNMQPYPGVHWEKSTLEVDYVRVYDLDSISEIDAGTGEVVLSSGIGFTSTPNQLDCGDDVHVNEVEIESGHAVTLNVDLSLESPQTRVFLAGDWNAWGTPDFELFHVGAGVWSGTKNLEAGDYQYVVTSGDNAGWGPLEYAPELGSECDAMPANEWNNFGFSVSAPTTVSICATFCAETCSDSTSTSPSAAPTSTTENPTHHPSPAPTSNTENPTRAPSSNDDSVEIENSEELATTVEPTETRTEHTGSTDIVNMRYWLLALLFFLVFCIKHCCYGGSCDSPDGCDQTSKVSIVLH